jgi:iron complex outermembrane receptor protein
MTLESRPILLGALSVAASVLVFESTFAQERESGVNALMDEVTVTARKREESLQDTPIAVSAFSGDSLDARGIQRVDDIAYITPNMSFDNINTNGGGGNSAAIFLRGVGQRDFIPSADPGVGLYVDGVYFARSVGSVLDLIDVERVEVLRGPQGTLFGRNTTGGAISIVTVKPNEEFSAKVRVRVGVDNRFDVLGNISGALADNLFASATAGSFNQDGFVENPLTGLDTGDDDTLAFRGALRWVVNDDVEINFSGDYSRDRENGQARVISRDPSLAINFIPPNSPTSTGNGATQHNFFLGVNSPWNSDTPPFPLINVPSLRQFNNCDAVAPVPGLVEGTDPDCINANNVALGQNTGTDPTFSDHDVWGVSATIDWAISDNLQVKSITAYRDVDSEFAHDGDNTPYFLSWVRDEIYEQSQFSQELQLLGTSFDDRLNWILGVFYFTEDGNNFNPVDFAAVDIESGGRFDHESIAGFAQGTYDITERLHLTAGIRYTDDTKDFIVDPGIQTAKPIFAPPPVAAGLVLIEPGTTTLEADDWTPMVNVSFDWTDDTMVYATYSEGFKSGGVQQRNAGVFGAQAPTYDPEFVESYEVGLKYNSPGGDFVLNAAAFYADYTDIQLETLAPDGIAPQLDNAGTGEIQGIELETRWSPLEDWFFEGSVGYLDAEITESDPSVVNSGGPSGGEQLPQVPEWSAAASVIKEFGLGSRGSVTTRVDYSYRSKVYFSPANVPTEVQDAFGLLNASVAWNSADDKYGLTFHANNITDERIILYTEAAGSSATQNDILARDFAWYLTGEVRW